MSDSDDIMAKLFKQMDEEVTKAWYDSLVSGYGFIRISSEEEIKRVSMKDMEAEFFRINKATYDN